MASTALKTFVHPHKAYRLEFPAHWEHIEQDNARSCGFGPHERDDVGLWISIMPMSVDTERLAEDLPKLMEDCLPKFEADNFRHDSSLRHTGMKADIRKEGQAGHYWVIVGGDIVLFASSQVPAAERELWNPAIDRVMASLQIDRDEALLLRQAANDLLQQLRAKYPEQDYRYDEKGIRGKNGMVFLGNLHREVAAAPHRREEIVRRFIDGLSQSAKAGMGEETWDDAQSRIVPVLKPRDYIEPGTATEHVLTTEWLADVVICYAITSKKFYRFVTGWDVRRWESDNETLHEIALNNLRQLPWPSRLEGSRQSDGGRIILLDTPDNLASSRLLHPDLYRLFSGPLGNPFWVGIPDRNTLVAFSDRRNLKQRIGRKLKKDFKESAYPITPNPFLVTRDGIAPNVER